VGSQPRHVIAGEEHLTAEWLDISGNGTQTRGFTGAIGTNQRGHVSARHVERNAPEHLDLVIARLQTLHT
jgi:hypothetical protein